LARDSECILLLAWLVGTVAISAAVVAAFAVISKTVAKEKAADDAPI
jgi:hypothetical protein